MLKLLFTAGSPYKKKARFIAALWTLLIIVACFTPGEDFPKVDVPLADKWVHFVLFAGFTFFWLLSRPLLTAPWLFKMFLIAVAFGSLIEIMQGILASLHRNMEFMDVVADSIGGSMGIVTFCLGAYLWQRKSG